MTTNITTLALNLLISERLSHRNLIASKIISEIECLGKSSDKEEETKQAFISVLHQCIANPTCQFRDLFYKYAEYYSERLAAHDSLSAVA